MEVLIYGHFYKLENTFSLREKVGMRGYKFMRLLPSP